MQYEMFQGYKHIMADMHDFVTLEIDLALYGLLVRGTFQLKGPAEIEFGYFG